MEDDEEELGLLLHNSISEPSLLITLQGIAIQSHWILIHINSKPSRFFIIFMVTSPAGNLAPSTP